MKILGMVGKTAVFDAQLDANAAEHGWKQVLAGDRDCVLGMETAVFVNTHNLLYLSLI